MGKRFLAGDFKSKIPPLVSEETDPLDVPRRKPRAAPATDPLDIPKRRVTSTPKKFPPDIPDLPDPDKIPRPKTPKLPKINVGLLILLAIIVADRKRR